jgi:hypothetical protein
MFPALSEHMENSRARARVGADGGREGGSIGDMKIYALFSLMNFFQQTKRKF